MKKLAVLLAFALGCDPAPTPPPAPAPAPAPPPAPSKPEPEHIAVQHILISFDNKVPGAARSMAEAEKLATELLDRVKKGESFDELMKRYSDDRNGLPEYKMANHNVAPGPGEYPRKQMVAAFGDVGFPLEVGAVGLAVYDPARSKYGWHIIKRVK